MTLQEITQTVLTRLGEESPDLSDRIALHVFNARAFLLHRSLSNKTFGSEVWDSQEVRVPLEFYEDDPYCSLLDCDNLRSAKEIPETLRVRNTIVPFNSVRTLNGEPLTYTTIEEYKYHRHSMYKTKYIHYTMINKKLYILDNRELTNVSVKGIFFRPDKLKGLHCDNCGFDMENDQFPISKDLLPALIDETARLFEMQLQRNGESPNA